MRRRLATAVPLSDFACAHRPGVAVGKVGLTYGRVVGRQGGRHGPRDYRFFAAGRFAAFVAAAFFAAGFAGLRFPSDIVAV